jgi:uncharacterized protein YeeX (DUF496 family)
VNANPRTDGIRLGRVEIDSAGPIGRFHADLAPLTLIYAGNERGKTTLVENLVACLFRQRKEGVYPLVRRDFIGASRVTVQGISKKTAIFTSLAHREKLDDLMETVGWILPRGLFDLLVVRAAELEIVRQQGGLIRRYLKSLVSREELYETLRDRLPGEVSYTKLKEGVLVPMRRIGSYKTYEQTSAQLTSLQSAAEQFYASLSGTELAQSLSRKASLQREKDRLQLAKRHSAFLLHRSIEEMKAELDRFDEGRADRFCDMLKDYFRIKAERSEQQEQSRLLEKIQGDLRWLQETRRRYEQCLGSRSNPAQIAAFAAAGCSLAASSGAYFFAPNLLPVFLALTFAAFALVLLFTFAVRKARAPEPARAEIREIKNAYRERFGSPLHSLADFDLAKGRLDRELGKLQAAVEKRGRAEQELKRLLPQIRERLGATGKPEAPESEWTTLSEGLRTRTRRLRSTADRYQERLDALGIEEIDYLEQAPQNQYSRGREEQIARQLQEEETKIREEQERTQELRERLIEHIGPEAARSPSPESLAEAIEEKRGQYKAQVRNCLAEMIAGHVVAEVLESVRDLEDRQLESTLRDPRISELLNRFTGGRYDRVNVRGEQLFVENDTQSYALEQMSSGAREQVLLALRMGLASIVCGKRSLFLILDDAFQYSDWQRREALVLQAVEAVRSGWQVIYLTMDDDIRDRFSRAAETLQEQMFALIEL